MELPPVAVAPPTDIAQPPTHVVSGLAASCLVDLLGAEAFADQAVEWAITQLPPLTEEQRLLMKVAAIKAAMLVMAEVRTFVGRES